MTVLDRVAELRERAAFFTAKRRKDGELYSLLADTLAVCETVDRENMLEQVRAEIAAQPKNGRNRTYAERTSDVYSVVSRLVFHGAGNTTTFWRYAAVMRRAAERQISGDNLAHWLAQNGGVNTLLHDSGRLAARRTMRTLHLNHSVSATRGEEITLVLRMDNRGFFDVLRGSSA